jgi:hypothetical protein
MTVCSRISLGHGRRRYRELPRVLAFRVVCLLRGLFYSKMDFRPYSLWGQ